MIGIVDLARAMTTSGGLSTPPVNAVARRRRTVALVLAGIGLLLHNWWVVVYPLGWMPSFNALISEAAATNQAHGWLLSGLDIAVGVLMVVALTLQAPNFLGRVGRAVWWWSIVWAVSGLIEGAFPLACSPTPDKVCGDAEWKFQLAYHHYVHMGSGVIEYVAVTFVAIAAWRTPSLGWLSGFGKWMSLSLFVCYPFIGATFFTHRLSSISEAMFFVMFSVIIGGVVWYQPANRSADEQSIGTGTALLPAADDAVGDGSLRNGGRHATHN